LFTFRLTFVYQRSYGASGMTVGALIALSSLSYLAGTFTCRRWLAAHGIRGAVRRGAWLTAVSAVLYAALALGGAHSLVSLSIAQVLFSFGHGIHQPCGQAGVVGPFPQAVGGVGVAGFIRLLPGVGAGPASRSWWRRAMR
jgi:DHA1 family bicyclomycin/chloramphenicol resistance-like MFS transporter